MPDKVKPLKIESPSTGGTQTDMFPTEANPASDYITGFGFAFRNSDNFLIDVNDNTNMFFKDGVITGGITLTQLRTAVNNIFDNSTNGFVATNVQTAIEEARAYPRVAVRAIHSGAVGNNTWIGPDKDLADTPLATLPVKYQLNEISWASRIVNVGFSITFRTVSKTGTIFYTLVVTSPNSGFGSVSGLTFTLNAGTTIWAQYIDQGTNVDDLDLTLWLSRVP